MRGLARQSASVAVPVLLFLLVAAVGCDTVEIQEWLRRTRQSVRNPRMTTGIMRYH